MSETSTAYYREQAAPRAISTSQLMGQVLFLVAIAIGFCALGTVIGTDLSLGTARAFSFAGFGMLLVSSLAGERFRVGSFAMFWLSRRRSRSASVSDRSSPTSRPSRPMP